MADGISVVLHWPKNDIDPHTIRVKEKPPLPDLFLQIHDEGATEADDLVQLTDAEAIAVLETGEIVGQKLIPWGSNYSFAAAVEDENGREILAIYKPESGETPLWDFPDGTLYKREVASYRLTKLLGWDVIPPTVIHDGPLGPGSLQLYRQPIEPDPETPVEDVWGQRTLPIEQIVLFDHIANNADRKIAHCLIDHTGKIWGIDHGLTFNVDFKLRTVLWQFVGMPVTEQLIADMRRVREDEATLRAELEPLLNESELITLMRRMGAFVAEPTFPILDPNRNIPYGWW